MSSTTIPLGKVSALGGALGSSNALQPSTTPRCAQVGGSHKSAQYSGDMDSVDYTLATGKQLPDDHDSWLGYCDPSSQHPHTFGHDADPYSASITHPNSLPPSHVACSLLTSSESCKQERYVHSAGTERRGGPHDDTKCSNKCHSGQTRNPYPRDARARDAYRTSKNPSYRTPKVERWDSSFESNCAPPSSSSTGESSLLNSQDYQASYPNGSWLNDPTKQTLEPEPFLPLDSLALGSSLEELVHVRQQIHTASKSTKVFVELVPISFAPLGTAVHLSSVLQNGRNATATVLETWKSEPAVHCPDDVGQKIQLRLHWPGYRPQVRALNIKDFTKDENLVTKDKLFQRVRGAIKDMMQELEQFTVDPQQSCWRVGKEGYQFEDVFLVSVERRSKGSWQPEVYVRNK